MVRKKKKVEPRRTLSNIGALESASVPSDWLELPRPMDPDAEGWSRVLTYPGQPLISMTFAGRAYEIDEHSATYFQNVLLESEETLEERQLGSAELSQLGAVMRSNFVGDNQHTNPSEFGTVGGPQFNLEDASVVSVSDRMVLEVCGRLVSGARFCGVFYDADPSGRWIEEFYLETPDGASLKKHRPVFDSVLATFVWK